MNSQELIDSFLTAPEAAEILGLTRNRIGRLCLSGRFKGAVKKDRFWLIPREEVEHYTKLKTGPKPKNLSSEEIKAIVNSASNEVN